jgi:deoxycytidylate deaminase
MCSQNKSQKQKDLVSLRWLGRARAMAAQSVCHGGSPHPKVKVGAILVNAKGREIARASNGFANGIISKAKRMGDNQRSLWINCAEQIALARAARKGVKLKNAKLYVTLEPCATCAGLIAEAGIAEVVVPADNLRQCAKIKPKWKRSIKVGRAKLEEAGIKVTAI